MIIAQDVSKTFAIPHDGPVLALPPTSVEVGAVEVLCLCGDSGSGKSTLLRILGLLRTPHSGRCAWTAGTAPR